MNRGTALSSGEFVWYLHSGDVFGSSNSVQRALDVVSASISAPEYRWAYGYARVMSPVDGYLGLLGKYPFALSKFAAGGSQIPHQAAVFSRSIIDAIGGYSLSHGLAADQLFMLQAAMRAKPAFIPEFLCDFDSTGAGTGRDPNVHFRDMRKAARQSGYLMSRSSLAYMVRSIAAQAIFSARHLAARSRVGGRR
jgi:hypothetical protein